jgi:hypothetical protein
MTRKSARKPKQKLGKRHYTPIPTLEQIKAEQTPQTGRQRGSVERVAIGRIASSQWVDHFSAAFGYVSRGAVLTPRENPQVVYVEAGQLAKHQNIKDHMAFDDKKQKAELFISELISKSPAMRQSALDELTPDFTGLFIRQRQDGLHNLAAVIEDIPTDANRAGFIIRGERLSAAAAVLPSAQALRQVPEVAGDKPPIHKIWVGSFALGEMTDREFYAEVVPEMSSYLQAAVPLGPVAAAKVVR